MLLQARLPDPFCIQLVNPDTGHPVQTWRFDAHRLVRIGRAEGNEVVICDPSVSRFHAELQFNDQHWELVNLGKNGTLVSGQNVTRLRIDERTLFRLGSGGPLLRFELSNESFDLLNTITGETPPPPQAIQIDESQKDSQVQAIVDSEYFQHLQGLSLKLRKRCSPAS